MTARSTSISGEQSDGCNYDLEGCRDQAGYGRAEVACGEVSVEYRRFRVLSVLEGSIRADPASGCAVANFPVVPRAKALLGDVLVGHSACVGDA